MVPDAKIGNVIEAVIRRLCGKRVDSIPSEPTIRRVSKSLSLLPALQLAKEFEQIKESDISTTLLSDETSKGALKLQVYLLIY